MNKGMRYREIIAELSNYSIISRPELLYLIKKTIKIKTRQQCYKYINIMVTLGILIFDNKYPSKFTEYKVNTRPEHGKASTEDDKSHRRLDEATIMSKEPVIEGMLLKSERRLETTSDEDVKVQEATMP